MTMRRSRGGFTLVEVMLAGAIAVLMTLALMEGIIVAAKISRENSQLLAAEAFAWDTAWKWLNKAYDDLPALASGTLYDSSSDTGMAISEEDCPEISSAKTGSDPRIVVRVVLCKDAGALERHGKSLKAKRIDVDVEWGPEGDRKCLNGLCGEDIASYGRPISVYKSPVNRGTVE
ncbi:MAG: prepilin-type N-terminal cleavage/methylation domain-containing protein [Kiritimatiellae bacterium]|nr:prepilin-type N-terminal cleavage/methylation domain-containing protein [Kiritimatiellia bacterium]MBQ3343471.1 prepilin-type N-terminal cleavage/methylation domain-containing protein [Kiritimatiellia bacterium]MBQ6330065.1 prepilin-type N-terminal cleavage/methylation domain-containing protein [Kiritimatiellia bacterium]